MKLQLVSDCAEYSGYRHLDIADLSKANEIADNSCEEVIAFGIVHKFHASELDKFLSLGVSKLRRGGQFSFNFVNYHTFDVYNSDVQKMNDVLDRTKCVFSIKYVCDRLQQFGLKLITSETNASTFETTLVTERI